MDRSVKVNVWKVQCCRKGNVNVYLEGCIDLVLVIVVYRMKGGEGEKKKKTKSRPT